MSDDDLLPGVLAGHQRAIARMITRAESDADTHRASMAALYAHTGKAHIVGVTGVPGSGKSTLVRALILEARKRGRTVGVLAVDPSSPFTGGALLGDRIRMNDLSGDPGVFIRSMATRGALGGLARAALDAVDVLDAAGFDLIVVETVGVGQDEVDIARAAHTVVVVSAPGLGDEIQAIKSGILEIADIHAVSKCDKPESARTLADLKTMLLTDPTRSAGAWLPPVIATSAEAATGIRDLLDCVEAHRAHLALDANAAARGRAIAEARILKIAEETVRASFARRRGADLAGLIDRVASRALSPRDAARALLVDVGNGG